MEAKVKQDARYKVYQLFSGREFVKSEWRDVPAGFEDSAKAESLLDVREKPEEVASPVLETPVAEVIEVAEISEPPAAVKKAPGRKAAKVA